MENQNFIGPPSKKKKCVGELQEVIKKKERTFSVPKRGLILTRKDFDADKAVQNSKLRR